MGNTIDVETFELQPVSKKPKSRYILQSSSALALNQGAHYTLIAVILVAIAFMLQGFVDPEGNLTKGIIPASLQNAASEFKPPGAVIHDARLAAQRNYDESTVGQVSHRIMDLLHMHRHEDVPPAERKAIVVHHDAENDGVVSTEVHVGEDDVIQKHKQAKKWEDLSHHEQKQWKETLGEAGLWAVGEGETILKGIFFGQLGGLVGQAAAGVIG